MSMHVDFVLVLKQVFEDIHNNYLNEKEVSLKGNAFADRVRSIGKQALGSGPIDFREWR